MSQIKYYITKPKIAGKDSNKDIFFYSYGEEYGYMAMPDYLSYTMIIIEENSNQVKSLLNHFDPRLTDICKIFKAVVYSIYK